MVKNLPTSAGNARDMGLIPGFRNSPGEDTLQDLLVLKVNKIEKLQSKNNVRKCVCAYAVIPKFDFIQKG